MFGEDFNQPCKAVRITGYAREDGFIFLAVEELEQVSGSHVAMKCDDCPYKEEAIERVLQEKLSGTGAVRYLTDYWAGVGVHDEKMSVLLFWRDDSISDLDQSFFDDFSDETSAIEENFFEDP